MTKSDDWAPAQAKRIADTVKDLRGKRSGQWLSDETAKAGHRISRTTISELESGKRKSVTTAELCVLAWALKVPPIRLLFPDLPDGPVEVLPGKELSSFDAVRWFSGEEIYTSLLPEFPKEDPFLAPRVAELRKGAAVLELARQRADVREKVDMLLGIADEARESNYIPGAETAMTVVATSKRLLENIISQLRRIDGAVVADGG
jgi:transcriptional regulator with XRE-family HTH domain